MNSPEKKPLLIVIVGPTAVGKTSLSIRLAQKYQAEIISADSRQFYKEMEIGTAKPSNIELAAAPHHLVNNLSIAENYSVGQFEKDALMILEKIFMQQPLAIMVGGSGLYVDAVCKGLDEFPEISPEYREDLNRQFEKEGLRFLQQMLEAKDPEYYNLVDKQNPQRLIRALEVILATGKTFTSFRKRKKVQRPFEILKIGLEMDREVIYERINLRMDQMIAQGLFEEAEKLYPRKELNALQTVGYQEIFGHLNGEYDREEAIRLLKRNSRRYAKRQMTWFKRDDNTYWFHPSSLQEIERLIDERLKGLKTED